MKYFFYIVPLLFSIQIFGQEKITIKKNISFYLKGNLYKSSYYQRVDFGGAQIIDYPEYKSFGYNIGVNFDLISLSKFHFGWNFSYRYINLFGYYIFDNYITVYNGPNYRIKREKKIKYIGLETGPYLSFGNIHNLEMGINLGVGRFSDVNKKEYTGISYFGLSANEICPNIGYKYAGDKGLFIRIGGFYDFGRSKKIPLYGGYLSVGYSLISKKVIAKPQKEKKTFITISTLGYLFDLQENIIGVGLQFDHFLYNTNMVNIGYSIVNRIGTGFWGSTPYNISTNLIILYGDNPNIKFESSIGPNLPVLNIKESQFYRFIHFAVGVRYTDDFFVLRFGTSTSGILTGSVGIKIGNK